MSDLEPKKKALPIVGDNAKPSAAQPPAAKRHLPILPTIAGKKGEEEAEEDRPPWHWSAIGAVAIFLLWLPLAFLTNGAVKRLLEGSDSGAPSTRWTMIGLNVAAFALACFGGGFLVGRFGGRAGRKEATVSGVAVAAIAWTLAAVQARGAGALIWALLLPLIAAIAAIAARAGGRLGLAKRSA